MAQKKSMKVKLLKNTWISGKAISAGKTIDVSEAVGQMLIGQKSAVLFVAKAKEATKA